MHWIPVKERVPESDATVLVFVDHNWVNLCNYQQGKFWTREHLEQMHVKAWMPIEDYHECGREHGKFHEETELFLTCYIGAECCEDCTFKETCDKYSKAGYPSPAVRMATILEEILNGHRPDDVTDEEFKKLLCML